jgi:hypothetical protein
MNKVEEIEDLIAGSDFHPVLLDGFDDAIIGLSHSYESVIYDLDKIISVLISRDGMNYDQAIEFFEYSIDAHYGEGSPIFCNVI